MKVFASLRTFAARIFRRTEIADDLQTELLSHIAHRADDLERAGLPRAEAERRARIEFGAYEYYREAAHASLGGDFLRTAFHDLRIALRLLRKSPGFTVAAIVTLALAIGANAVVFSVMNGFLLRPLNVPDAASLYETQHGDSVAANESYPNYLDFRERNHSFENLMAWNPLLVAFDPGNDPSRSWAIETSGNYFDGLKLEPYLGRFFHASDERGLNSAPYVVLSYSFWHTRFHDDRSVIGRLVQLNRHPFTIIGVAPEGFRGTLLFFNPDVYTPLVNHPQLGMNEMNARSDRWVFMVMGHLKKGVTQAQAIADLDRIGAEIEKAYPREVGHLTFTLSRPNLYGDYLGKPVRAFFGGLASLSGLILLAACANLGSLFSARAADRAREVALRIALGSTRKRILRGLFTEALLLSLAGGAIGLLGSMVLLRALSAWHPFPRWPLSLSVAPDAKVYLVALLLTFISGFLFGAVPVRQVLRSNPYEIVKAGSTAKIGRRFAVRDVLLVTQIAICGVLVTSSFVAIRSLIRSLHGNFGVNFEGTLLVDTDLSMAGYSADRVPAAQQRMVEALAAIPGVESVGLADNVPLGDGPQGSNVFKESAADLRPPNAAFSALLFSVSPQYFQAVGTPLLAGRPFTRSDDKNALRVAVVNREFARKLFGSDASAIGRKFKMPDGALVQIVGMTDDGKYASLTEDTPPVMFLPILQEPSSSTWLIVRSGRDPQELAAAMRTSLRNLDSGLPVYIQKWVNEMDPILFGPRMATVALGVLGVMGAMLSITGIFGMAAYSVSKRLRELGIRVALGAGRKEVLGAALGHAFTLLTVGSASGLVLGLLASRVLASIVYQATPRDPLVLAGVLVAMAMLGLLATWLPAQRALSVDPLILLREE
jgi:predicted permease